MKRSPEAARLWRLRPLPHEVLAIGFALAGVAVLESLPVTYPRSAILLVYASYLLFVLPAAAVVVLAARLAPRFGGARSPATLADEAVFFARVAPALVVTLSVHFLLKSFVWLVNPRTWDRELLAWDQALHLGVSPSRFLTTLLGEPHLLRALDLFYSAVYFPLVVVSVAALLSVGALARRLAFATALQLVFVLGAALYIALPSWGPVFVVPDDFAGVLEHMPGTVSVQRVLHEEVSSLVRDPLAPRVVRFGSVAAFPSLHVAVVTLFAIASRAVSRTWFRVNVALACLMVVGSVVTGYHYLLDAWAGAALAALAWWVARRLHRFPAAGEPDQAAA